MTTEVWPRCGHPKKDNICNVSARRPHGQCRECWNANQRRRSHAAGAVPRDPLRWRCGHSKKDNVCNVSAKLPGGQCRECRRATDRRRARRNTPTRVSWLSMRQRCTYPAHPYFHNYGGRGIKVCDRWRRYKNFLADMGKRPPGMTLDRIDVNGNYEAGNCRWATASEQRRNQRAA